MKRKLIERRRKKMAKRGDFFEFQQLIATFLIKVIQSPKTHLNIEV
jgi:hypothetical protein